MRALEQAIGRLAQALSLVGAVALVLMMTQVTLDVLGKYLLNQPVPMTLETVSNYYMVAVVFLPLGSVERRNGHIHVELIYGYLPRIPRRVLDLLAYGLGVAFMGLLTQATWELAVRKYEVGEFIMGSYSVITWPSRFLVPAGGAVITLLLLLKLVRSAVAIGRPEFDPDLDHKLTTIEDLTG